MHAIWSGEIAFGLVTIPTQLFSATHDLTPKFHLVHKGCGARVQMVRRCPKHDKDLAWNEIEKAFEVSKGEYAKLSKEEITEAEDDEAKGTIEIVEFVKPSEVDLAFFEKSYWVAPSGKTAHSFTLLRTVLEKSGRVAIAKVALRSRTRLAMLRPRGKFFSLDMLRFADELVGPDELVMGRAKVPTDKEVKLAETLVGQLTSRFDPEKHPDEYRARIAALVDEKVEKKETTRADEGEPKTKSSKGQGAKVINLSELLARSLQARPGPASSKARKPVKPSASPVHRTSKARRSAG